MRQKFASNGNRMIGYQCVVCGGASSPWLKQSTIQHADSLPQWDADLNNGYWERKHKENEERLVQVRAENEKHSREWWDRYNEYLKTPAWRSRRSMVIERAGGWCEGCKAQLATQAHHLSYAHVGAELMWELVAVCDDHAHRGGAAW